MRDRTGFDFSVRDVHFMRQAMRLARRGKGCTSPNPAVGAVIVRRGRVVGRGWHQRAGEAHAEVGAITQAGASARGATMYVTLEPCCTRGRTPPCTDAIGRAGLKRVVVASRDPNPLHDGRGVKMLRRRGIDVEIGLLRDEAAALNEDFAKYVRSGIPFTTAKMAMTMDGKIATVEGDSRWISGPESRHYVHRMRLWADAIVVGRRTVELDDPLLTARTGGRSEKTPWRVIISSDADIPLRSRVLQPPGVERTIIATLQSAPRPRLARLEALGAKVLRCRSREGRVSLKSLWRMLGRMNIMSVILEGGGETVSSALEAGLVDKFAIFIAPKIIGGRDAPTPVEGKGIRRIADAVLLNRIRVRRLGGDILLEGYL
jgi:diaminohydroxyphosphoribosylaminopyrimidine deaminase/5-amino-6-(5-phosphoribosylamino)uracil reductase